MVAQPGSTRRGCHRASRVAGGPPSRRVRQHRGAWSADRSIPTSRTACATTPAHGPRARRVASVRTIKYSFIETCFACGAKPGRQLRHPAPEHRRLRRRDQRPQPASYGVDEAIVRAIIHAESAFNPNALSRAGAQGLMQLMPATARRFGVTNSFDAGAEHPRRRAVPGLAAEALQRQPDPGRGRLQRRRRRGRPHKGRAAVPARPSATSSAWACWPTVTAAPVGATLTRPQRLRAPSRRRLAGRTLSA